MSACVPTRMLASVSRCPFGTELVSRPDADADLAAELLDREEVLLGQRLGRRHQRAAVAAFDRAQERVQRDHGLARADVALEEPLHRRGAAEVGVDLGDRALLVGRELGRGALRGSARSARRERPARERRRPPRRGAAAGGRAGGRAARRTRAGGVPVPPPPPSGADGAPTARRPAAAGLRCCFSSAGSGSGRSRACTSAGPTTSRSFFGVISSLAG